jgi:hypothetical protein
MSTRPSTDPRWADVGADIVEPTSGKKDIGWEAAEKPPAQYFNWFMNLVYQWQQFFAEDELHLPPSLAVLDVSASAGNGTHAGYILQSDNGGDCFFEFPIVLPPGFVINAITVYMKEANLAGEEIEASIWEGSPAAGSIAQKSTTKTSGVSGALATMGWTSADSDIPLTIASGKNYFVQLRLKQTSASLESEIWGIVINP